MKPTSEEISKITKIKYMTVSNLIFHIEQLNKIVTIEEHEKYLSKIC